MRRAPRYRLPGFLCLLCLLLQEAPALETVTIGQGGELDWQGRGAAAVGTLDTALYLSNIFDAGGPATWIRLRWEEESRGDPMLSQVQIRTRTGTDDSPFVFTRSLRGQPSAEEIHFSIDDPAREMTRAEFESLPSSTPRAASGSPPRCRTIW